MVSALEEILCCLNWFQTLLPISTCGSKHRSAPWKFVPIYVYWAVFDTQAAADAARAIDVVNLARNHGVSADVPVNENRYGIGGNMTLEGFSSARAGLHYSTNYGASSVYSNLPHSDARWYVATVPAISPEQFPAYSLGTNLAPKSDYCAGVFVSVAKCASFSSTTCPTSVYSANGTYDSQNQCTLIGGDCATASFAMLGFLLDVAITKVFGVSSDTDPVVAVFIEMSAKCSADTNAACGAIADCWWDASAINGSECTFTAAAALPGVKYACPVALANVDVTAVEYITGPPPPAQSMGRHLMDPFTKKTTAVVYTNYEIHNSAVLKYNISWSPPVLNGTTGKYDILLKLQLKEARGGVEVYWSRVTENNFLSIYDGFEPSIVAAGAQVGLSELCPPRHPPQIQTLGARCLSQRTPMGLRQNASASFHARKRLSLIQMTSYDVAIVMFLARHVIHNLDTLSS